MRKHFAVAVIAVALLTACKKKTVTEDFTEVLETATAQLRALAEDMKNAKDAKAVAVVLNKVYETMQSLKTKGQELEKKHNLTPTTPLPPELRPKRYGLHMALSNVLSAENQKILQKYAADPDVFAALGKLRGLKG